MPPKGKVLVIDDELIVLKSCARILTDYEVDAAQTGSEGLARLEQERFDLVITDMMMPGMSGVEVLRAIRRSRPGLPVVLITGFGTDPAMAEANELRPDALVPKPFTPEELVRAVEKGLGKTA